MSIVVISVIAAVVIVAVGTAAIFLVGSEAGLAVMILGTVGVGVWIRQTRGPGRHLLSPAALVEYRGRAIGNVVDLRPGESVTVRYEVSGAVYQVTEAIREERREVATDFTMGAVNVYPSRFNEYTTTSLGDLCLGGEIRVRYDLGNPARAVLVSNEHWKL